MIDLNEVQPFAAPALRCVPPAELARGLSERIEDVAHALFGEPNPVLSTRAQLRFGTHGSLAIEIAGEKRGEWYDHENKIGGGVLDLVRKHTGLSVLPQFEISAAATRFR